MPVKTRATLPSMDLPAPRLTQAHLAGACRWLPCSLAHQILLLTFVCLALSIMGYGYFRAVEETAQRRHSITEQMVALAKNLATVDAYFLQNNQPEQIETLTLHTATVDGIYSVLVTDFTGRPLSEVVNKNGVWSPRYNVADIQVPGSKAADSLIETQAHNPVQRDFLAGSGGTLTAWQRIASPRGTLGWVRINYRLDSFDAIASQIRRDAAKTVLLATLATLLLLSLLLRPSMRALREATAFASQLDLTTGARLKVWHWATEIEALGNALNLVSDQLLKQHAELSNQKFALDAHAIVSITDLNGTIVYANQRFCDISGYRADELLGQNHRLIKSGEHPPEVYEELWHTITHGQVWHGHIKNRKKDGSFYWVSATIVPLLGLDGLPHQYIGIRTDITANKELEQHLKSARDQALAATTAKGQFLANMSHEIRTPMNAVLGMLKLLQNTELDKRQMDYANKAESAAQTLLKLLNDILDFSKIDAGKMTLEVRRFRLDKLMRDISVIVAANLGQKPIEVLFDIDPAAPKALMGDALRLQQVLINLSSNAIKFTRQGEVVVSIRLEACTDTGARLRFAVRDSGIGIAAENQAHIFDGFSQAEASTTRRFGGTGLGLSISRQLVALMGGELSLYSQLGQGSTFSFSVTLPVAAESAEHLPALAASHLRVLVVDDNPTAREVLAAMVASLGWQADLASDGQQALALMQAHAEPGQMPYQAVFMDWQMPGMDGWQTLDKMQSVKAAEQPPIVVMVTANGRQMLAQRSAEDQARLHGFLVKPVTASMLHDAVADALNCRHQPAAAAAPMARLQPLQGLRLLVVEDNLINQQVAQEMLSQQGATVELADNGQLGVDAVRKGVESGAGFDAVLMDIQMPVMDGYAATRVLRHDMGLTQLPIIAMTANAMASDREACLAAGMNAHMGKPFNLAKLVELLLSLTAQPPETVAAAVPEPASARLPPASLPESALPPVDAVDVAAALERLGGNQSLYGRVLRSYLSEIAGQPEQLDAALNQADWERAARLLHTLKGLSATVGASYLAAFSRKAELAVKAVQQADAATPPLDIPALCSSFRAAVQNTCSVMQLVADSCTPVGPLVMATPERSATSADQTTLLKLQGLLQASDMAAVLVFEQLQLSAEVTRHADFPKLVNAMAVFDFAEAARLCQLLQTTRIL